MSSATGYRLPTPRPASSSTKADVAFLITGYSISLFMNPLNFVADILIVLLVNVLATLNIKKRLKNVFKSMHPAALPVAAPLR